MLEQDLDRTFMNQIQIPVDDAHLFGDKKLNFQKMMMMYSCAIREVKTKLQVLNDELTITSRRNPIEFIKYRIKQPESISTKLLKKGYDVSVESAMEHLSDVAGVRVICAFIDDIYKVADMLTAQDDIVLIRRKDYIQNPKPNGYRSLHLIVEVPVFFSDHKENLRVEVQIRTIAMDFWASLEHQLKYKKDIKEAELIIDELKSCADVINQTDTRMQSLRDRIVENQE